MFHRILALLACFSTSAAFALATPRFEPGACAPSAKAVKELAHARCGSLVVLENRGKPRGRTIRLPVAILPSASPTPMRDPIVHMSGGPGGDVFAEAKYLVEAGFNGKRDIIIMAQRGTLDTEPALTCPEIDRFNADAIGLLYDAPSTKALHLAATRECHDRLVAQGIDLDSYNTTENAFDYANLREALKIEEWNVHGYSYGTDLALTFMREHPLGIRSVILDSVVPPSVATLGWAWTSVREAFDNLVRACDSQPSCRRRYPDLGGTFARLVRRLEANPIRVTGEHEGRKVKVALDGGALVAWLVGARPPFTKIPSAIKELEEGHPTQIANERAMLADKDLLGRLGHGLAFSVFCSEWVPYAPESEILAQGRRAFPAYPDTVLAQAPQLPFMPDDCRIWGVSRAPSSIRQVTRSDIPTLVVSGSFDMRTSPMWGEYAARTLSRSTNISIPGVGHWAMVWSPCAQSVLTSFLATPTKPDTSCVATLNPPPFGS